MRWDSLSGLEFPAPLTVSKDAYVLLDSHSGRGAPLAASHQFCARHKAGQDSIAVKICAMLDSDLQKMPGMKQQSI